MTVWRSRLCLCGKSVVDGELASGRLKPVEAEASTAGKYELWYRHNSPVPGLRLLPPAKRFGKTELHEAHNCRYSNGGR